MKPLFELAKVLRSKNAGPFELTFDILFDCEETYRMVKDSRKISEETICRLYSVSGKDIRHLVFYDQALGIKITITREVSSGSAGDRDVYGAQQHAPLMNLLI